jgi:hypothetical protein
MAAMVVLLMIPTILDFWAGTKTKHIMAAADRRAAEKFHVERAELLKEVQRHGIRYEVRVRDWGSSWGDERWRWAIFNADALLSRWSSIEEPMGAETPFDQGNAPTRVDAEIQALAAVEHLTRGHQQATVVTRGASGPHGQADPSVDEDDPVISAVRSIEHFSVSREALGLGPHDS